jgi:hypothetical protein
MGLFSSLFGSPLYPREHKKEVDTLLEELFRIGKTDDYLSERPGRPFNNQCRHSRAREIGQRLYQIGGLPLMEHAHKRMRKRLGADLSAHLEYCWAEVGDWLP